MTTQQILDTGVVPADENTETLEEVKAFAQWQIDGFRNSSWGAIADDACRRLTGLIEKIDTILNSRRGLDGMTPVKP